MNWINRLAGGARCEDCLTMQDRARLIHAKLPHEFLANQGLAAAPR
jgi:hypothetical protein